MKATFRIALFLAAFLASSPLFAAPVPYEPPADDTNLKPGPGMELTKEKCGACHSFDYIEFQPRGAGFGRDFWEAEVTKMVKVNGAQISEAEAKSIVAYLTEAYR